VSVCLYSCCSNLEHRASVKFFISLQFPNLRQSVGLHERRISPPEARYLHRKTQTQHKMRRRSISLEGFEPAIPTLEWVKIFYALECDRLLQRVVVGHCLYLKKEQFNLRRLILRLRMRGVSLHFDLMVQ
jgi:hypothetical protein